MPKRFAPLLGLGGVALMAALPAPAFANDAAAVANGIKDFLLAGMSIFVTLAIVVVGLMFWAGRGASQMAVTGLCAIACLGAYGTIVSSITGGDATAVASVFRSGLIGVAAAAFPLVLVLAGYSYMTGRGSFQVFVPILAGLILVFSAAAIAELAGF